MQKFDEQLIVGFMEKQFKGLAVKNFDELLAIHQIRQTIKL